LIIHLNNRIYDKLIIQHNNKADINHSLKVSDNLDLSKKKISEYML